MPTDNPALNPTATRVQLAKDIKAGRIRRCHWSAPWTLRTYDDRDVTDWVKRFIDAGLADYGKPKPYDESAITITPDYSIVSLTPAGEEWLNRYGGTE